MAEATVCYVVPGGVDGLCSLTDERGLWELPRTRIETLRIQKKGYLRQTLSAVPRDEPVRMRRAASIHVRVVDDVTGEGIDGSSVNLLFPTGRRHGPFFPNDEGVIVHSLEPGSVRVMVSAEGYRTPTPAVAELPAAEKTEVVVRLRRADDAD